MTAMGKGQKKMMVMYLSYFIISLMTNYFLCLLFVLSEGARDYGRKGRKGRKGRNAQGARD
jgi:hypothetical protein